MSSSVLNNQRIKLFWIKNLEPFMAIKVEQITTLLKVKPRTSVHSLFNLFPNHFIKTCTNAVGFFLNNVFQWWHNFKLGISVSSRRSVNKRNFNFVSK